MKADLPPDVATAAEAEWVRGELIRSLMRTARSTRVVGLLLIFLFAGVLWSDTRPLVLGLWAALAFGVAGLRLTIIRLYGRQALRAGAAEQVAFYARYGWIWPLSALAWGLSPVLHFDRAPLQDQFICWLILAGLGMFAINSFSFHLRTMRAYLNVLALVPLTVMLWRIGVDLHFRGPTYHYWLVLLLVTFWLLLLQAGRRLHVTHRKNFELQYRNMQLIESLTRQTHAALDAVEIKNRFLASAAHDLRQPVHALGLYADWLSGEPELVKEIAPKIVESTKAVNALFDSLFDLVRLDSGKIRLTIEPVDLDKVLHDLEVQYRPLAEAKGLQFRLHGVPGTVVSDPILLQRVVGNLVSNAIKYTDRGGILVASRVTRRGRRIEVWDTGMGIALEHQREIFREFYKVPAHEGTQDGFGLGLYIVARLSSILGHPLDLASRPGRGTVFRLDLDPTDPQQAAERAAAVQLVSRPWVRA
ncbi:MAG: HAMP domain-containing histidine kinase [Ramlibacter sp.]|nr:HAMP domain-containing histidine kinase [Ramlibacter sp.]